MATVVATAVAGGGSGGTGSGGFGVLGLDRLGLHREGEDGLAVLGALAKDPGEMLKGRCGVAFLEKPESLLAFRVDPAGQPRPRGDQRLV